MNHDQDSYRVSRDISKSHEFDQARSPVSLSNSLFNNFLSSILLILTIETPSLAATFNITERPTATDTLLVVSPRNLWHPATASPTNEAIDNLLGTIECSSIRSPIISEIQKEIEPTITQKGKPLLENSESLIKSARETYDHQIKVLKEELHCKNQIINTLLEIIGTFGNDKRDTQPVPLINKVTDSENDPKSDNDNKVTIINSKYPQKNSARTVDKKVALTQF